MVWLVLVLAGLLEVAWSLGLRYTHGFTRPLPSLFTGAAIIASMILLARATRTLPIGTAYAIWVGIGVVGATLGGLILHGEALPPRRAIFLALLVVAILGLKLTAPEAEDRDRDQPPVGPGGGAGGGDGTGLGAGSTGGIGSGTFGSGMVGSSGVGGGASGSAAGSGSGSPCCSTGAPPHPNANIAARAADKNTERRITRSSLFWRPRGRRINAGG